MRIETRAREIVNTADLFAGYQAARARLWAGPPKPVALPIVVPPGIHFLIIGDDDYARLLRSWSKPDEIAPAYVKVEAIQRIVARHYNFGRLDLLSACRTANVVRPRQIAMYLTRKLTLCSMPDIGRRFGGRDHTTVLHAVRKIERLIGADLVLAAEVATLITACGGLPE